MFFMNKDTLKPISSFDEYNSNIERDSLQIMFVSNDNTISFKTTLFLSMYDMSTFDYALIYIFEFVYLFFSLISWHTNSLGRKVSIGSMQAVFASSSFVLCWMFFAPHYYSIQYFILALPPLLDLIKNISFLIINNWNASSSAICGVLLSASFAGLKFVPTIWINLFPSLVTIFPLVKKILKRNSGPQNYLTLFEVSNWICMCLWMGYIYLYPGNFYLFSPKPLLVSIFFGIIFIQFLVAFIMQKTQRRGENVQLLLDNNANQNLNQTSHSQPQNIRSSLLESAKHPFKYTLIETEDDLNRIFTNDCAICCGELIEDRQQKLYKTPCDHIFHQACLKDWGAKKLECPCCRKQLPKFTN